MSDERERKIEHLLSRNVEGAIDGGHLHSALRSGKKLRVKLGIDPTSPDLHLGHAVVLRKLREFQDLGCVAVLIIGDFTAGIGDPSGRDKTRPPLAKSQIDENMRNYLHQAGKVIDLKKTEVVYNSKWLGKLNGQKLLELLGLVSVQQIIGREDFQKRLSQHQSIRMNELIYPLMQAYDSVATEADVELGGTDQTFNLLVGRDLMEKLNMAPQDIVTTPLLEGLDGARKMSKSLGNYVGLNDAPKEMFGKVMSIPDALINKYFMLCTDLTASEIGELAKELKPRDAKERLGFEIVKLYHGEMAAAAAKENFAKVFSRKETPDDLPELKLKDKNLSALDIVMASGVTKSKGEARRLIEQGGFEFNKKITKNPQDTLNIEGGEAVRIGKKRFFRVIH